MENSNVKIRTFGKGKNPVVGVVVKSGKNAMWSLHKGEDQLTAGYGVDMRRANQNMVKAVKRLQNA